MSQDLSVWGEFLPKMSGGVFVGVAPNGDCLAKGYGEIDPSSADALAGKLILLASQLRLSARHPAQRLRIH